MKKNQRIGKGTTFLLIWRILVFSDDGTVKTTKISSVAKTEEQRG